MNRNGFTLVELLGVLIIISLLIVLSIPAYASIYTNVRRENYNSKIKEITNAALKYGSNFKDEIKNSEGRCITTNVDFLIKKGELLSEEDIKNVIYNPTNGEELSGDIKICYSLQDFDLVAYYVQNFEESKRYYKNEIVTYSDKMYRCVIDYPAAGGIYATNDKSKKYFEEVTY